MILVEYGEEVPSKPVWVAIGGGMAVLALGCVVPLGVVLRKRSRRSAATVSAPTPRAEP